LHAKFARSDFRSDGESRLAGGFFVTHASQCCDKQPRSFNGAAEVFNTVEEKFVEKRELNLVTPC